jgi:hypothetical protein
MPIGIEAENIIATMNIGETMTLAIPDWIRPLGFRDEAIAYALSLGKNFSAIVDSLDRTMTVTRLTDIGRLRKPSYHALKVGEHAYSYPADYGSFASFSEIVSRYAKHMGWVLEVSTTKTGAKVTRIS